MKKFFAPLALLSFVLSVAICPQPVLAQSSVRPMPRIVAACGTPPYTYTAGDYQWQLQDTNGNICTAASVSASISGFTATSTGTPISVTTGGVTGTLPAGAVVVATNVGATNGAYCALGASATTSSQYLSPGGGWFAFTVGGSTQLTCITGTSTTTVNMTGGAGLPTGTGGGGGGGSGGAVTNAGTFAVQLTGATNNINNVSGTVSLPTGASTAALQPTNSAQGATTSGQTGHLVMGAVTTSAPTYTTAQTSPFSLDTTGSLRVNVTAGGGTGGTSVAQGSTTSGQNVSPAGCVTLTAAPTNTTAQTNMLSCDTAGSLRVNVTSATGVAQGSTTSGQSVSPIGCRTLTSAPTDTTAQTNMPWCNTKGSLVVAQPTAADLNATVVGTGTFAVQMTAGTTGGTTPFTLTAANSTNATNIKASAGLVDHVSVYNNSATLAWVSFYDNASTPTCGTAIKYQVMIPANSTSGAGAVEDFSIGVGHASGIGICVATGIAGTGSVAASSYVINVFYK